MLSGFLQPLADLLWPPVCALCSSGLPLPHEGDGPARHFCCRCFATVEYLPETICAHCGRPFFNVPGHICGDCLARPPLYRRARSAVLYQGAAARSIARLKYYGDLTQVRVLADLARTRAEHMMREEDYDLIVPMPVSTGRLKERGFNQALELAWDLFAPWRGMIDAALLKRQGNERVHQAALSAASRSKAIKGCFGLEAGRDIGESRILLFDDVFTTGATAAEAAATLLRGGAASVDVFTVARTVLAQWR